MANLTKRKAMTAYRAVCKKLGEKPNPNVRVQGSGLPMVDGPVLYRDYESWTSTTKWAVVWEDGDHEWTYDLDVTVPDVFFEPIESFSLGLYPDD